MSNSESSKIRGVSVTIPTNLDERLDWLKHRLNFLYKCGHEGEVVVGVWGGHDKLALLRAFCDGLSPNIKIIVQDGAERFTARFLELAQASCGKYILQIGDDDFLLPASFRALSELLEKDASVYCAQGRTFLIDPESQGPNYKLGTLPLWAAPEHDLLTRYARYFEHPGILFHAMLRRADFIERMTAMDEIMEHTKNPVWWEVLGEFFAVIKGRFVILDEVFMLRGFHAESHSLKFKSDKAEEMFPRLLQSEKFTATYKVFEDRIFKLFASRGVDVTAYETREIILAGILGYIGASAFRVKWPHSPEEENLKMVVRQMPMHPVVDRILQLVHATRVPA